MRMGWRAVLLAGHFLVSDVIPEKPRRILTN
jgi:hypothetical protein